MLQGSLRHENPSRLSASHIHRGLALAAQRESVLTPQLWRVLRRQGG